MNPSFKLEIRKFFAYCQNLFFVILFDKRISDLTKSEIMNISPIQYSSTSSQPETHAELENTNELQPTVVNPEIHQTDVNEENLSTRLSETTVQHDIIINDNNINLLKAMLVEITNISAGLVGVYLSSYRYVPRTAGIIMATPSGIMTFIISKFPKYQILQNICICFLAGIIGSRNYHEFLIGYLATSMLCKILPLFRTGLDSIVSRFRKVGNIHDQTDNTGIFRSIMNIFNSLGDIFHWQSLEPVM